jgi:type IV secretory pathway VirD2 relaxase
LPNRTQVVSLESVQNVSRETIQKPLQLLHWNSCKIAVYYFRETRRGDLVRHASKSGRFSHHPLRVPEAWHGDFAACGQRSGLLALNLANIFEKLLDQKTF